MILQAFLLYYGSLTFNSSASRLGDMPKPSLESAMHFLANFDAPSLFNISNNPKSLPCLASPCEERIEILR